MAEQDFPTASDRRRAVCTAMAAAPGLVRYAARYTACIEDAEDAYQRALEIALTRAPVTEKRRFMAWLYTVLKHEAMAVRRAHNREGPAPDEDLGTSLASEPTPELGPDGATEWRQRYRALQDALASLTEPQRICLMLQSAGASYHTIEVITGFSRRKVERSVLEGRRSLHQWELRLAQGEVCGGLLDAIEGVASGDATGRERRAVRRHLRHCPPCGAVLRNRRQSHDWLGALVPAALLAAEAETVEPDPSPAFALWERAIGTMAFRLSQAAQLTTEIYAAATTKAGIGAATVAVAGAAGGPIVVDAMQVEDQPPPTAEVRRAAASGSTAGGPVTSREPNEARATARPKSVLRPTVRTKPLPQAQRQRARSAPIEGDVEAPHPTTTPPAATTRAARGVGPASSPAPTASSANTVALEFGP